MGRDGTPAISGLALTGGFRPPASILALLESTGLPVVLCRDDTFSVSSRLKELRFKIRPEDTDKIESAKTLVRENVDVASLLRELPGTGSPR
jgi:BioD-like phosphotransacetylase family protein